MATRPTIAERVARDGFRLDEEPLRQWILKAYHEEGPTVSGEGQRLLGAVRELLSGPDPGYGSPLYWFQDHPDVAISGFIDALDEAYEGLFDALLRPLLASVDEATTKAAATAADRSQAGTLKQPLQLAPNLSAHIAFHAGPIALKTGIDETIVCSLLSSALIVLSKIGTDRARAWLSDHEPNTSSSG